MKLIVTEEVFRLANSLVFKLRVFETRKWPTLCIVWINDKAIIEFRFRTIWKIMQSLECYPSSLSFIISSDHTEPYAVINNYNWMRFLWYPEKSRSREGWPITLTETLIILDITKTESNNNNFIIVLLYIEQQKNGHNSKSCFCFFNSLMASNTKHANLTWLPFFLIEIMHHGLT